MSEFIEKKFTFVWEIENFDYYLINNGKVLKSPVCTANILKSTSWYLKLSQEVDENIACYLGKTEDGADKISLKFIIELITDDDKVLVSRSSNSFYTFSKEKLTWGYWNFYGINKLKHTKERLNGSSIILRCLMILRDSLEDLTSECKAWTKVAAHRSSFRWNVEEIDSSSWKACQVFLCSVQIEIVLTASEDFVNISVKKVKKGCPASNYVICKLSLLDLNEVEQESKTSDYIFESEDDKDTWQFPNFLLKSKFKTEKSKYIKDGKFTLMCEFYVSNGNSIDYIKEHDNNDLVIIHSGTKEDAFTILQQDLRRMYMKKLKTDVDFRVENCTFQAHKNVLSARSPVFAAMFEQNMLENQTGVVDIPDVDANVLECFLEFIYTGTVDNMNCELALKLLFVADKYQVSSLKTKCSFFLMLNISTANVCDVIVVANMIEENILKAYAMDYIADHADAILISEGWSQCLQNNGKLATEILYKLSSNFRTKIGGK